MTTVILGVIGSDAHVVGITLLEHALEAAGFEVHNLGVQTSRSEFVAAAKRHDADAVLVSSLYGHARQDCAGLHEQLHDAGVQPVTYVGGNLSVGQDDFTAVRDRFRRMGFDRVFDQTVGLDDVAATLAADLRETETDGEHAVVQR
ncbi:MAG: methylaspartate mutase subunit S [Haloarculaceae archaeon]